MGGNFSKKHENYVTPEDIAVAARSKQNLTDKDRQLINYAIQAYTGEKYKDEIKITIFLEKLDTVIIEKHNGSPTRCLNFYFGDDGKPAHRWERKAWGQVGYDLVVDNIAAVCTAVGTYFGGAVGFMLGGGAGSAIQKAIKY